MHISVHFDLMTKEDTKIIALTATMRATVHQIEPAVEVLHKKAEEASVEEVEVISQKNAPPLPDSHWNRNCRNYYWYGIGIVYQ